LIFVILSGIAMEELPRECPAMRLKPICGRLVSRSE
jgi:hypothetical protein